MGLIPLKEYARDAVSKLGIGTQTTQTGQMNADL